MLVLHAAWDTEGVGALVLWAEDGDAAPGARAARHVPGSDAPGSDAPASDAPGSGASGSDASGSDASGSDAGASDAGSARTAHPFAAPADLVAAALVADGDAPVRRAAAGASANLATFYLPARHGVPAESPELLRAVGAGTHRPRRGRWALQPFAVPAVRLWPLDALDVLVALGDEGAALRVGASVRALARLGELALEVVAGGRVVPGLERRGRDRVARWAPLRTGRDTSRLMSLCSALPLVVCGLERNADPGAVATRAFDAFVDVLCRDALAGAGTGRGRRAPLRATQGSSPADAWLRALGSDDGTVEAGPAALAALDRLVEEWRAPLVASGGSWRLCLRLHEPPDPGEVEGRVRKAAGTADAPWRLELLLQAVDEPTLLVAAAEVWRAGDSLRRAARTVEHPQEVLLADLGRAVHAFPELAGALAEPAPTALDLDVGGAHRFLSEVAPALELAGFGVLLPSWWRRPSARLGLRVRSAGSTPARAGAAGLTGHGLAAFDWEAALGDDRLGLAELRRLARLKAPLVRVRGQWTELRPDEVQRLVEFLSAGRGRRTVGLADVLRAAAGAPLPEAGVPVVAIDADGPVGALLRGEIDETLEIVQTPEGFRGELRPYQRRGVSWIRLLERLGLGACLADDMGLGKTATVLGVLQADRVDGVAAGPTLVVCPTSVVGNWQREVERFTPALRTVVHHGATRARGDVLRREVADADVVVTSYALAERDRTALASVPWARIVLDEAQQVKNPSAKQTQAVRTIPAPRRLALTGTPVENHLGELWSIMEVVNPGLLGSQRSFREQFAVPIERYGEEEAADRLRTLTRPFVLRRVKTDRSIAPELPEKLETKERCSLTREQATLYQAVVDEMLAKIADAEGIERRGLVLATMLRLKQVCNHPSQYAGDDSPLAGRSGKLERTVEILEQVRDADQRALVFTQFAEMGALLERHLTERLSCRVGFLHGGVPRARRDELVAELQSPEGAMAVMVLSLKAGGTGLNLTAASHVLHYDRWWNPAVEDQATDRSYRIGQRRDVQVRKLVCAGTVEDRIDEMIESKRALAARVVGTGEGWLTELSTDDLAEVLRLSADVVQT